jgi:hypothetical protein
MATIQDIKDYIKGEFDPLPIINDGTGGSVDRAVEDAIQEYNEREGVVKHFNKSYSGSIDLSTELASGEKLRTVVDLIPGQQWIKRTAGDRPVFVRLFQDLGLGTGGDYDVHNKFTNALLNMSFREQIKGLFGLEPDYHVEGNIIYPTNFPNPDTVHVVATVTIPEDDDTYEINEEDAKRFLKKYGLGKFYIREGRLRKHSKEVGFDDGLGGDDLVNRGQDIVDGMEEDRDEFNAPMFS